MIDMLTNLELHSISLHNDPLMEDRDVRIASLELHSIPLHNDPLVDDRDVRITFSGSGTSLHTLT